MDKDEITKEVLGFLRTRCSELLSVIEAGMHHFPEEQRIAAAQFVATTKGGLACASNLLEGLGPLPGYDDLDEWYDEFGRPCANGCYDAAGHYYAERDGRLGCDED